MCAWQGHRRRLCLPPVGLLHRRGTVPQPCPLQPLVGARSDTPWPSAPPHAEATSALSCIARACAPQSSGLADAAVGSLQPGRAGSRAPRSPAPPHVEVGTGERAARSSPPPTTSLSTGVAQQDVVAAVATSSTTGAAADSLAARSTLSGPKSGTFGLVAATLDIPSSSDPSPAAVPFYLGCTSGGRMKHRRWADANDDGEDSDDDLPKTYLDVVRRPAKPIAASTPLVQTCSAVVLSHGGADVGRQGPRRR